ARTRHARAEDGRPPVLLAFAADSTLADRVALLRAVPILRRYGMAPRALCAGDAIDLQGDLRTARVPWQGVPAAVLQKAALATDDAPLRSVLAWERPALVQATGELPALAGACRAAGVPLVERPPRRGVPKAVFARGIERVLRDVATTPVPAESTMGVVAIVGDLSPEHHQLNAIEALAGLGSRAPRLRLWGNDGGSGYAVHCARRARALGVADRVELLRPLSPGIMLAGVDLVLDLDDRAELADGVALAISSGVEVLSRGAVAPAGPLIDGVTGWRLEDVSSAAIAAAISRVLGSSEERRRQVRAAAHRWARAELHPTRLASETWRAYLEALRARDAMGSMSAPK